MGINCVEKYVVYLQYILCNIGGRFTLFYFINLLFEIVLEVLWYIFSQRYSEYTKNSCYFLLLKLIDSYSTIKVTHYVKSLLKASFQ